MNITWMRHAVAACLAGGIPAMALAQTDASYPTRPVRLVVPFPPGGATDFMGRLLAKHLSERFRQQVVVENRAGAGSTIGTDFIAKSAPDGYNLLIVSASHAVNAGLFAKLPYDAEKSFAPVSLVGIVPLMLVTHPSVPVRTVGDLVKIAKAKPGQLNFGSSGTGSTPHLAGELLKSMAGIDLVHVPYKGAGPSLLETIAGQVEMTFAAPGSAQAQIQAGKLRGIAVTSAKRASSLPNVPTIAESGYPGYEAGTWHGILAPAATPTPIVSLLSGEIAKFIRLPDVVQRVAADGVEPVGSTPEAFLDYVRVEIARWKSVIQKAGIKPD